MSDERSTVFRFTAEGIDLEFAGTESFVEKQVERFRRFLEGATGLETAAEEAAAPKEAPREDDLASFYRSCAVRTGRGAIQDHVLLFFHYLKAKQGRQEIGSSDLGFCFSQLGIEQPKNLSHHLGQLKRAKGFLEEGSRRGLYALSPKGQNEAIARFGPLD